MGFIVAVDGPAGSGKGSVTKVVADKLNLVTIDTGAMYRCVTLNMLEENVGIEEKEKISNILSKIKIEFREIENCKKVFLNGEDVTLKIRTNDVNKNVSQVSTIREVRECLAILQRKMGDSQDIIMEGRDIGTNIFPNANVKIYLDASVEERANRRYKQNMENGITSNYNEILESVKQRDYTDSNREIAPLKKADDAIYIDSTDMTIEQVIDKIVKIIKNVRQGE